MPNLLYTMDEATILYGALTVLLAGILSVRVNPSLAVGG